MAATTIPDYPLPKIFENLSLEQLIQDRKDRLLQLNPSYADVIALDSDPIVQAFQVEAYQQLHDRQRVNDVALAQLLAFATDSDLDAIGEPRVYRAEGESNDSYRLRIRQDLMASSTAGPAAHYRSKAISVDPIAIRDVAVDSPKQGAVRVSVLVRDGYDVAEIVSKVRAKVTADDVFCIGQTVTAVPAEAIVVDVVADVSLLPDTPQVIFDELKPGLIAAWKAAAGLGWDMALSWLDSRLHKVGVYDVDIKLPLANVVATKNQHIVPGNITLNLVGRRE
ncbi:baseplate J/gp47 family protein [Rheinheimera sp.]|uniref:baseplate J/gp47 family protein n=1 Tax=Rheinheimera sp. TaxID=1869214 RepID=UPI00307F075A